MFAIQLAQDAEAHTEHRLCRSGFWVSLACRAELPANEIRHLEYWQVGE
jgi:hypothetical protein